MNPSYFRGESGIRASGIVGFDPMSSQTDRPTTPLYLMQQSNEEQYQRSLTQNITDYFTSPQSHNENELTSFLLPKDVNYYYNENAKVLARVEAVFERERQLIESQFDDFLKQILLICEERKNEIYETLANDQRNFGAFYERFKQEVRGFLQDAQMKLDKNMSSFNSMINNVRDDYMNPLEFHIHKLKLQRKQMDHVEATIQEIHVNYNRSPIPDQKKTIERLIIDPKEEEASSFRRTSIDQQVLGKNLKSIIETLTAKMKNITAPEVEQKPKFDPVQLAHMQPRIMSPQVFDRSHFNQLSRDLEQRKSSVPVSGIGSSPMINSQSGLANSPVQRPSSHEGSKAFLNLNLESSQIKKEKKNVQFKLPTIEEEVKQSDNNGKTTPVGFGTMESNQMKTSNISININNRPYNHNNYINIYNAQQHQAQQNLLNARLDQNRGLIMAREKSFDPNPINSNSQTSFRPSSVNLKSSSLYGLGQPMVPRPNSSINDLDQKTQQQLVLSVSKTNLLSKANSMSRRYTTQLLLNDYNSKIHCFEIDPKRNMLFYGTSDGEIYSSKISFGGARSALEDDKSLAFGTPITFMHQIRPNLLLVATDTVGQNLFTVDIDTFKVQTQFKTYKEKMKLVAYFDSLTFIIVTGDDKLLMYDADNPTPKKSFKIPTARLVDVCMPSAKLLFTGAENGDIRIIKINQESGALAIEGSMKVENPIISLEVFYNNEKLLLVNSQAASESLVYIINTQTKKVMNIIKQRADLTGALSYVTITLLKKPPEIYLVGFGDDQISFCDIDDKQLNKFIEFQGDESFHLKKDLSVKNKLVKLLGYNLQNNILAVGLCTSGLMLFTLTN